MTKPMVEASSMLHRRLCHFAGRVQGVGFRYTTKNIAMRHNVTGYVRNLPDGRVELVLEGPPRETEDVVQSVSERMNGYIQAVDQTEFPATGEFSHFCIRGC